MKTREVFTELGVARSAYGHRGVACRAAKKEWPRDKPGGQLGAGRIGRLRKDYYALDTLCQVHSAPGRNALVTEPRLTRLLR